MVSDKNIRTALYNKLNVAGVTASLGSGSASIVHGVAQPTALYPIVVFNKQSSVNANRFGGEAYRDQLWLVKAVSKGTSSSTAEDVDKAINDLLNFGSLTITGGDDMSLMRESDVDYVETVGSDTYRHHGALYRLRVQDS